MITEAIFRWAEATPDRTALIYNGRIASFRMFAAQIAIARGYFARQGWVGPGVAVLAIQNLRDFWLLSLALRSLGATTITIGDPALVERLDLPDVRGVITSPAEVWPGLAERCAERGLELLVASPGGATPMTLDAGGSAQPPGGHILETSGTTGAFKKVLIDPAFEAQYLGLRQRTNDFDRHSLVNVFGFPAGTGVGYKSTAGAWLAGAGVIIHQSGPLYEALRIPGMTYATVTPAMLAVILAAPEDAFPRTPAMRLSVTGGSITQSQIDSAKARITPQLYNGLGATESNIIASTALNTPDDHRWHKLADGAQVEVVDDEDRPVAVGQVGHLRVGTAGGPAGYLHDEAATRTFFRHGFFYTGDLAVVRQDGRIALQGRVTEVINVLGRKISPAPIEDALREALGVTGVCLASKQNDAGEEEIHVALETPAPVEIGRLTAALSRELAGFPQAHVHYVVALPRNAMGKVLRQAVRNP